MSIKNLIENITQSRLAILAVLVFLIYIVSENGQATTPEKKTISSSKLEEVNSQYIHATAHVYVPRNYNGTSLYTF